MVQKKKVNSFRVELCQRSDIKAFIEKWHYSQSINGIKASYCFRLLDGETIIGAMIYGRLALGQVFQRYVKAEEDLLELRRLCCIDDTPCNTESFFIGYTLRWLKKNSSIKRILSYADNEHNHFGTIYKASNFVKVGETAPGRMILYNGRLYHDKCIRTTYKGKLKPFAERIKSALLAGSATYKKTATKNIFIYDLRVSSNKESRFPNG